MTRNIVDIINESRAAPMEAQPTPTEKAQIAVMFASGANQIFRFKSTEKGEKAYKELLAAWKKVSPDKHHLVIEADMFVGAVDLYNVVCVCYVDHPKRVKFVPYPA